MTDQHDTVVVKDSGSSGMGMILGIIAIIVVLAAAWYFLIGPGAGSGTKSNDINVDVNLPSQVAPAAS